MKKRILVVAMLDSIHSARWLGQFSQLGYEFTIAASKKHKNLHPELIKLLEGNFDTKYKLSNFSNSYKFAGYLDFLFFILASKITRKNLRVRNLLKQLTKSDLDYVHALEIQGAGYLLDEVLRLSDKKLNFILTNWGSDIYFYQNLEDHRIKITSALETATHYSAECVRDYRLARNLGFKGVELPCIPNAGGFDLSLFSDQSTTSTRSAIVAKAYGGDFGRGDLIISALSKVLPSNPDTTVHLYSVTDDLLNEVKELQFDFPKQVSFNSRRDVFSRERMRKLFLTSRVYIGASVSDGISTSYLEALISGCYPIQTSTSCANEWVSHGAVCSLVDLNQEAIEQALANALVDDALVDYAQLENLKVSQNHLAADVIKPIAITFYQ